MPTLNEVADIADLCRRYAAGESIQSLATSVGFKPVTVYKWMRINGLKRSKRIQPDNLEAILARYVAGENEYHLAAELKVSRAVVRRWLQEAGIARRSCKETTAIHWQSMTPEQRIAQVDAAHKASRGRICTEEERARIARSHSLKVSRVSEAEVSLRDMLAKRGVVVQQQTAVGRYNLDLSIESPPIAIECFGGGWHASGRHAERHVKRFRYLLDKGWACVIVWHGAGHGPMTDKAAEYIQTLAAELASGYCSSRQYKVIRGSGEAASPTQWMMNSDEIINAITVS